MEFISALAAGLFLSLLVFAIISALVTLGVYGKIIKDEEIPDISDWTLNTFNKKILSPSGRNWSFISHVIIPIVGKYYMFEKGIIPWWSPKTKEINKKFKELWEENGL